MPRKGHIAKRDVLPDPIYNNKLANFEVQTDVTGKSTIIIRNIDNLVLK